MNDAILGGVPNALSPAGPAAHRIASLGWFVVILFTVVTVIMWGLVFWASVRRRGSLSTHLPVDAPEDMRWIVVGGFAVPAIAFATIFLMMLRTMSAFPMGDAEMTAGAPDIRVTGHQWWWEVEYLQGAHTSDHFTDANEIHVPAGRTVDIELRAHDVIHSFWVPRLHGKVDLLPDLVNRIRIQADSPGVYRGQCAEYCGPQHAHMALYVVAHAPGDFDQWLAHARRPAAPPATPMEARGRTVFMNAQCVLCHRIAGTEANGRVGPDLTHIGSRLGLASNTLPNETASLEAWVTHAQSLKPNSQMPNITAFDGEQLRALAAYLQGLK